MKNLLTNPGGRLRETGLTLVELMVALAIGSIMIIGAVQIYSQSRQAYIINESIARVQETANFAMDTIEADLRMASNWGRTSRGLTIEGRSLPGNVNPLALPVPADCGADWSLDLALAVTGSNNGYGLPCGATGGEQGNSDVVTVRRASAQTAPLEAGRLQVQSTRVQGQLFANGAIPAGFTPVDSTTHNLLVNSYYVAADSNLVPGVPTLRRKSLGVMGGGAAVIDQEIAPGVENLQVQFGVDVNADNGVDRYVNPGDPIYIPGAAGYVPGSRVLTARIWLVVRGLTREVGLNDLRDYEPGDIDLGIPNDDFRRIEVSKTILLRNTRT